MLRSGSTGPAFERILILTETIDVNSAQRIYALFNQRQGTQLAITGDSAQNAGQAASSAKNLAKEQIDFSLSSRKPRSSSSRSRFSCKSLPNTCVSCE